VWRVLPRAEVARVAFLLVEETAAGEYGGEICGSAGGGVPGQHTGRLADRIEHINAAGFLEEVISVDDPSTCFRKPPRRLALRPYWASLWG
jgi:hypothetical protein